MIQPAGNGLAQTEALVCADPVGQKRKDRVIKHGGLAPNKWFLEHCKEADLIIYECMLTPEQLMEFYGQPAQRAMMMQTDIHTSAQVFGKIMSILKPRHAVAYHFFNEEATRYAIYDAVRQTYDGPLTMAYERLATAASKWQLD